MCRLSLVALLLSVASLANTNFARAQQVGRTNPHGILPEATLCTDCHSESAWKPLKDRLDFDHSASTSFNLIGSHIQVSCESCHGSLEFSKVADIPSTECAQCHTDVHAGELSQTCSNCHTEESFIQVDGIQIHEQTSFPLVGAHVQITCESCHRDGSRSFQTALDPTCESCHLPDFENAQSIDHVEAGFPTQCQDCHNEFVWNGVIFDHLLASSGFELLGAHEGLACSNCHASGAPSSIFGAVTQNDCVACHQNDFEQEHGGSFPTTCLDCHNIQTWDDADFDHTLASNGFELLGAHAPLSCENCHITPGFETIFTATTQDDCISCHQADFNDEHAGSGFPTTCLNCHNNTDWDDAEFGHATPSSNFQLLGAHTSLACESCHMMPGLELLFTPSEQNDCVSCHQQDYDQEHAGSGFPTTCIDCHSDQSWGDAAFDHTTASGGFELLGAHTPLSCESCHMMPGLELLFTPTDQNDCVSCHQQDYDQEHAGSGFPTTCTNCHNNSDWSEADFDHTTASGGFELLGAHTPLACESCHMMPGLELLFTPSDQNDCVSCHQQDYDNEHSGSGFPTTCLDCHNNQDFSDATIDHDASFPINSGKHLEEWSSCQDCHNDPSTFQIFTCFTCHAHAQSEMSDKHDEVNGYAYESNLCLSCHPNGEK